MEKKRYFSDCKAENLGAVHIRLDAFAADAVFAEESLESTIISATADPLVLTPSTMDTAINDTKVDARGELGNEPRWCVPDVLNVNEYCPCLFATWSVIPAVVVKPPTVSPYL